MMDITLSTGSKEFLGIVSIILTFVAFLPYIFSIYSGKTKPHVFSWVIWGIATVVVYFAQMVDKGGAGAWSTGISGVITLYIAWLAYIKQSDHSITVSDWFFFITALAALPFWYLTSNPLWAVVILTAVDTIGFFPTVRKAYHKPYEEQLLLYVIMVIRNLVAMVALENYSLTTLLFPATIAVTCAMFVVMVAIRRRIPQVQQEKL